MPSAPSTDGITVAVHDLGGAGTPVLFSHATGFHGRVYQPIADQLRGAHSWAVDLRGHGDSEVPPGHPMAWTSFAADVLAALTVPGLAAEAADRPLVGVGHSGGAAALALAEASEPGTFAALWLFEPVIFTPAALAAQPPGNANIAEGARLRRPTFPSRQAAYDNFASKPPMAPFAPEALRAYVDYGFRPDADEAGPEAGPVTIKCRPEDEAATYGQAPNSGTFDALPEVKCPVVVVRGHIEDTGVSRFAEAVVERLPNGELEEFDDLDHFAPMVAPTRMAASIQALLNRL